jgi:hypothetical protein
LIKDKDIKEFIFKTWLEKCKHYDADYYEDWKQCSIWISPSSQNVRETIQYKCEGNHLYRRLKFERTEDQHDFLKRSGIRFLLA